MVAAPKAVRTIRPVLAVLADRSLASVLAEPVLVAVVAGARDTNGAVLAVRASAAEVSAVRTGMSVALLAASLAALLAPTVAKVEPASTAGAAVRAATAQS